LAKILGQGKSSRLYLDVYKDKQLVEDISSFNYTPVDRGLFIIRALLEPGNLEEAISVIEEHMFKKVSDPAS